MYIQDICVYISLPVGCYKRLIWCRRRLVLVCPKTKTRPTGSPSNLAKEFHLGPHASDIGFWVVITFAQKSVKKDNNGDNRQRVMPQNQVQMLNLNNVLVSVAVISKCCGRLKQPTDIYCLWLAKVN